MPGWSLECLSYLQALKKSFFLLIVPLNPRRGSLTPSGASAKPWRPERNQGKKNELFFPQLGHIWEGACRAPGEGGISCITLGEMRVYFGCVQSQAPAWDTTVPPAPEDVLTTDKGFLCPTAQ